MDSLARGALTRLAVAGSVAAGLLAAFGAFTGSPARRIAMRASAPAHLSDAARAPDNPSATLPLAFEANRGQIDERADFLARAHGYTLLLSRNRAVLARHRGKALVSMRFVGASR